MTSKHTGEHHRPGLGVKLNDRDTLYFSNRNALRKQLTVFKVISRCHSLSRKRLIWEHFNLSDYQQQNQVILSTSEMLQCWWYRADHSCLSILVRTWRHSLYHVVREESGVVQSSWNTVNNIYQKSHKITCLHLNSLAEIWKLRHSIHEDAWY